MSITAVGTPQTNTQAGGTSISVSYPTGHASGDVAYAYFLAASAGTLTGGKTYSVIGTTPADSGFIGYLLRRVLDGTEASTETFTMSTGNVYMVEMRLYRGVNNSTPEDTAAGNPQTGRNFTTSATVSGFTTNQNGDELLFFVTVPAKSTTMSTPSGFGNAVVNQDATNIQTIGSWDKAQASAGAIGTVSSTISNGDWFATLVAVQPASILGGWHPAPKVRRQIKPPPFRRYVKTNAREYAGGAMLLFASIRPLQGRPLRSDKPKPIVYRRPHFIRRVLSFNIIVFYFTAVRHFRRRFQPEVIPRFRRYIRQRPRLYSIGAWLVQMPVPFRQRAHKLKLIPYKMRKIWRRVGTLNVLSPTIFMAYIARHHKPVPVRKRRPIRAFRRASAGAGLLYMLAVPRRRKRLKLPLVLNATPLPIHHRFRRVGSLASVILFLFAVPRTHRRKPHPGPNPLPHRRYRTMRERYVGFMQAVGSTLDAIVNWRKRRGY